jgi:hypothetical protein
MPPKMSAPEVGTDIPVAGEIPENDPEADIGNISIRKDKPQLMPGP